MLWSGMTTGDNCFFSNPCSTGGQFAGQQLSHGGLLKVNDGPYMSLCRGPKPQYRQDRAVCLRKFDVGRMENHVHDWWARHLVSGYLFDFLPLELTCRALGTLILANMLTLLTMYDLADDSEIALGLLASVIYIQKADMEYEKINFEDFTETYQYFKKLYQTFTRIPDEEVDALFMDFNRLLKVKGDTSMGTQAHEIMRKAAEQIHTAFQELNEDSISATANFVLLVMKEALENLIELIQDAEDDDGDTKYAFQLIKDRSRKDPGAVLKDYEVLG